MDADLSSSTHPTDQTLRSYGLGKLDAAAAGAIEAHLEGCPDCRRRVSELSVDSFLGRMRDAGQRPSAPTGRRSQPGPTQSDPGPTAPDAARPQAGTLPPGLEDHPDYEVVRELGRGGMG